MNPVCERMKHIRLEFHLSQVALAKRLGITNAHVSKIEKGNTVPSNALIKLFCKELDVNELWLTEGILPIFNEPIVIEQDEVMYDSTKRLNKMFNLSIPAHRLKAAYLYRKFIDFASADELSEKDKVIYWDLCIKLLGHLDEFTQFVKDGILNRQLILDQFDMNSVCTDFESSVINDMRGFVEFHDTKVNE